ncbi:hypothetical protein GGR57DRAFT_153696 [Xylariaceae sp. FL1272]|nr:hypothetical protein GGR57DRAFT_153696 [Xylariaceae sp. FL1272]
MASFTSIVALIAIAFNGFLAYGMPSPRSLSESSSPFDSCPGEVAISRGFNNIYLRGHCLNREQVLVFSVLDLNHCIANNNGEMVQQPGGNFGPSCECTKITGPIPGYLYCTCDSDTGLKNSYNNFKLSDFIVNDNGTLGCFDARGCLPDKDPFCWWDDGTASQA